MGWLLLIFCLVLPGVARAQEWTSTDIGAVGVAGSATQNGNTWTVRGSGTDIWGTTDAFQFLHRATNRNAFLIVRVVDLHAANPFAKAGVMVRAGVDAGAATAVLDVKPDGGIEFMVRAAAGEAMRYVDGATSQTSTWLRLGWTTGAVTASTSSDGVQWTVLCSADIALPLTPEAGVAVTSHDNAQLATATFDNLAIGIQRVGWTPHDVGVGAHVSSATEQNGVWTIAAAGADIWGTSDSFGYLSRTVSGSGLHIVARIDGVQNTHAFAKAGVMLRTALDASAPAVVLDVTPGGSVEFMARSNDGSEMAYLGGTTASMPVWVQLSWSANASSSAQVIGSISNDGVTWTPVGTPVSLALPDTYHAGVAVTSHDVSQSTTVHVESVSLLPNGWRSSEVGTATAPGSAAIDALADDVIFTVEGAGADIWGDADAFHFVQRPPDSSTHVALTYRIVSLDNTNAMAKAGMMFRDSVDAGAPSVILDAKPDGGVEFMARLCSRCATTYLGGAHITFPAFLSLMRDDSTFTATVFTTDPGDGSTLGTVTVPMSAPIDGFAVTSHDPSRTTTAVFDNPAR